jgi:hypothetical protein
MMEVHAPVRVWGLGLPMTAVVVVAVLAVIALSRRRRASVQMPRTRQPAPYPVVTAAGGGRRYIWGVVLVLVVLASAALLFSTVRLREQRAAVALGLHPDVAAELQMRGERMLSEMQRSAKDQAEAARARNAVAAEREQKHRKEFWLRGNRHTDAPADPGPRWEATIEQSTFPSVRELNPQDQLFEKIAWRLKEELNLRSLPSRAFVADGRFIHNVETSTRVLPDKDPVNGEVRVITAHVALTPEGWQELGNRERAVQSRERMTIAARGLGLVTVLLGAVAGYIRLDDWTKGYYSGRLFFLATVVVAGLGFAIISI